MAAKSRLWPKRFDSLTDSFWGGDFLHWSVFFSIYVNFFLASSMCVRQSCYLSVFECTLYLYYIVSFLIWLTIEKLVISLQTSPNQRPAYTTFFLSEDKDQNLLPPDSDLIKHTPGCQLALNATVPLFTVPSVTTRKNPQSILITCNLIYCPQS